MTTPTQPMVLAWRRNPHSGKWHAWRGDERLSVCRYTSLGEGAEVALLPADAIGCRVCLGVLQPRTGGVRLRAAASMAGPIFVYRTRDDEARHEKQVAEFLGGRWDGMKLTLEVVQDGPTTIRVLEQSYMQGTVQKTAPQRVTPEPPR